MRVRDLVSQIGMREPRPVFFCHCCGGEYSADVADYSWMNGEDEMTCCEEPLVLVTKKTEYITYEPQKDTKSSITIKHCIEQGVPYIDIPLKVK